MARKPYKKNFNRRKKDLKYKYRVNEQIRIPEVRVVGDNVENGIYSNREAKDLARDMDLDLVEISPNAKPPVCKILDFQKFIFEQKKKKKEMESNQKPVIIKEIRLTPHTDDHDFNFKLDNAEGFLKKGYKVKVYVHFRGRSIVYKDQGKETLLKFALALEDFGKVEKMPKLEGKRMIMFIAPLKTK